MRSTNFEWYPTNSSDKLRTILNVNMSESKDLKVRDYSMKKWIQQNRYIILLALIISISHFYVAFSSEGTILNWYHNDDAYYYFKTAQNISEGQGVTFDGVNPTNGFHPLWMLICIPIFAFARINLILPLRLLILVQAILNIGTAILMFKTLKKYLSIEISFTVSCFWVLTPSIFSTITVGGLESCLNAFSITLLFYYLNVVINQKGNDQPPYRQSIQLGIIAAISVLSRLDNIFIAILVGIAFLLRHSKATIKIAENNWGKTKNLIKVAFAYGLPVLLLVGAYLSWNIIRFGSPYPVSGLVKQWWGTLGEAPYGRPSQTLEQIYQETFTSYERDISPFSYPYQVINETAVDINSFLAQFGLPSLIKGKYIYILLALVLMVDLQFVSKLIVELNIIPLMIACFIQIIYYKSSGHVAQRQWYWVMELYLIALLVGLWIGVISHKLRRVSKGKAVSIFLSVLLTLSIVVSHASYIANLAATTNIEEPLIYHEVHWLEKKTETGSYIAMIAAGRVGYFVRDRTIVNIDGLINSMRYFRKLQNGEGADFLQSMDVEYVFGSKAWIEENPPYMNTFKGRLIPIAQYKYLGNSIILWRLVDN
jgi:hypothetical protein